jgi:hypothetical protein
MPIYINKNGQQSGPYEDHIVIDQLRSGVLLPDDMAIRHGDASWQKLTDMFPGVGQAAAPTTAYVAAPPPPVEARAPLAVAEPKPQSRKTAILNVFFGLCFLGAIGILIATVYYIFTFGSSGDLEADLSRLGFRDLAKYLAIGTVVGAVFMFVAFLLSFKRKLIRSNGARIALRVFFVLVLFVGLGSLAVGAISYFTYSPPVRTATSKSNELLRALEAGSELTGPFETAMFALPIGAGLFLLGLSGILMTKRPRA